MNAVDAARRLLDRLAAMAFGRPDVCALCGAPLPRDTASLVCPTCLDKLAQEMSWVCQVCGAPVRPPLRLCPECRKNLYVFDGQRSAGIYQGDLRSAIARMKFQGERWLSRPLAHLMAGAAREFLPVDLIVPIPLEPGSRVRRGYNQALDLAKEMAVLLDAPAMDVLAREKRYAHQAELGRDMRWRNLKESMGPRTDVNLRGQRVLLVDDVTTTGATLDEAARVLKGMGAEKVFCVTAARTLRR
ncbi:MAG: ComF family protein [Bacillota bacterium]